MDELVAMQDGRIAPYTAEDVMRLEQVMLAMPEECHVDLEVHTSHHFAPGVYCRHLFIPAGTVLTGKIHRHETMNILISGTIRVTTDLGVEELTGPLIFNSAAGSKKAGLALTDVHWVNIHPTESTDLDAIEQEFIAPSFEALEQEQKKCLGQ